MSAPDARGFAQAIGDQQRNPDVYSGPPPQPVGPDSTLNEIIESGCAANEDVLSGAELLARGSSLQFHGTLRRLYEAAGRIGSSAGRDEGVSGTSHHLT